MQAHAPRIGASKTLVSSLLILGAAALHAMPARAQSLDSTNVSAVPTYEAVGLYWNNPTGATTSGGCEVKFRVGGSASWTQGLALVYDASTSQCRGSLVSLTAGTTYEAQLNLPGQAATKSITFTTWSNAKPVSQTIKVASGSQALNVSVSGSANGYVVYDGTGATLDAANGVPYNITINASYVIVRGFTLKGAQQHGILIDKNQHDVIIEDNDISNWGRTRDGTWGTDMDSGIRAICQNEELTRVTVQRNKIHDPRYAANSWAISHPAGPQGITFSYCGGNNVYRWNEITSSSNHYNDGMGGEDNFSTAGWPNKDSDVYGNKVNHAWDDGLEIEGGDMNVRVWGNYLDQTGTAISSTIDSVGPLYIFRNVWDRNEFIQGAACDSDQKQPMFKSGSSSDFGNGRRYLFHNTMLQRTQSGCTNGLGGGAGVGGTGDTQLVHNTVSMNNIYNLWKANGAVYQVGSDNTFQNDMYNGSMGTTIVSGINATPTYASGNGNLAADAGLYALAAGSAGFDKAVRIPNFNDNFVGAAPDVGAAEAGAPAMKFGIAAASAGSSASGTGTTTTTTTAGSGGSSGSTGSGGSTSTATGTTSVSASLASSSYTTNAGTAVSFTAAMSGNSGTPSGSVTFYDNSNVLSECSAVAVAGGKATCTTAALASGSHAIVGKYSGDATYGVGTAGPITQTVNGGAGAGTVVPSGTTLGAASAVGSVAVSAGSIDFGGQSMGTTTPVQPVTLTNRGSASLAVTLATTSSQFTQSSDCGTLAAGASCTVNVAFTPATVAGAVNSTAAVSGALSVKAGSTSGSVALTGTGEKSLVTHYYRSILRRLPDNAGKAFWQGEAARVANLGADTNEVWYALAASFYVSPEYAALQRDNAGFITDLYNTFFNRVPDAAGLAYWLQQVASGMPRSAVLSAFMYSAEFSGFTQAVFGSTSARAENDLVTDLYRGLLERLPDSGGFTYWTGQFRTAECQGSAAVYAQADAMSSGILNGAEYAARQRSNQDFVSDLYTAFMRRGGDVAGIQAWVARLDSGSVTRDQLRQTFVGSPEFAQRVGALVSQGCAG